MKLAHRSVGRLGRVLVVSLLLSLAVFVVTPLGLVVVFSFNSSPYFGFPLSGFTVGWYSALFGATQLWDSLQTSVLIAALSGALCGVMGGSVGYALARFQFRGRGALFALTLIPLLTPSLVLAIALQMYVVRTGLFELGYAATIIGHTLYALPFAVLTGLAWFSQVDWSVEEASYDLGVGRWETLRRVTLPLGWVGLRSGTLFGFMLSFNDFNMATFLARGFNTLPVYVASRGNFGIRPDVLAYASIVIVSITLGSALFAPIMKGLLTWSKTAR
jgi:spermidine/putrescine transport system permease protein